MASRLASAASSAVRVGGVFGAGALCSQYDSAGAAARGFGDLFRPVLSALLTPPAQAAPGLTAQEVQAATLAASLQAVERLIQAQRPSAMIRLLWIAAPLGALALVHHYGWARIGWVTGERLEEGLISVRNFVQERVAELCNAMFARFERVDNVLAQTTESVKEVVVVTHAVRAEVQTVAESLTKLEQRMVPLEENAATAAKGVEVLCELVKTSGLLNNASANSLQKLETFTGGAAPQPPRELEPPSSQPVLMAPGIPPSPPSDYPAPNPMFSMQPTLLQALVSPH